MPQEPVEPKQPETGVGESALVPQTEAPTEVPVKLPTTPDVHEAQPQTPAVEAAPRPEMAAPQEAALREVEPQEFVVPLEPIEPVDQASLPVAASVQPEPSVDELLKQPSRIRTLTPGQQIKVICDVVVVRDFPAAHNFIEALGKTDDIAFYAWLEDTLHDTALRDDWREYLKTRE